MHRLDRARVRALLTDDELNSDELDRMVDLVILVVGLGPPPSNDVLFPRYASLVEAIQTAVRDNNGERLEEAFLELYAHLHMHEAPYSPEERRRVDATGGYWAHAGGISPIVRAAPWIRSGTRSVDLGAGNGLHGLLLQRLYPHAVCCQIEISAAMAEIGRGLQRWLSIPDDRIEWRVADVTRTDLGGWDFVYLYRPVRPEGEGARFYERLARTLAGEPQEIVVFSIADCLSDFLPGTFERFFTDGHLTCYRKPVGVRSRSSAR